MSLYLVRFLEESNLIEGIDGTTDQEVLVSEMFLALPRVEIGDLVTLVGVFQPDAILRTTTGLNVKVGSHRPPRGGPRIRQHLQSVLDQVNSGEVHPYLVHHDYETLHPFSDGNGRSGRMLWAWQMINQDWDRHVGIDQGFLRRFYIQALEHGPGRSKP